MMMSDSEKSRVKVPEDVPYFESPPLRQSASPPVRPHHEDLSLTIDYLQIIYSTITAVQYLINDFLSLAKFFPEALNQNLRFYFILNYFPIFTHISSY
jgi:hypothetical protein